MKEKDRDVLSCSFFSSCFGYGRSLSPFSNQCLLVSLTPSLQGQASWGDYDEDGRPDLLIGGNSGFKIYHQNDQDGFDDVTNSTTFPGGVPPTNIQGCAVNWIKGDKLNFILTAVNPGFPSFTYYFIFYQNNGDGTFTNTTDLTTFPEGVPLGMSFGTVEVADYDNDGLEDFSLTGNDGSNHFLLYRQNQTNIFSNQTNLVTFPDGLPIGVIFSSFAWIDYDNDGLIDFFYSGNTGGGPFSKLYRQNITGQFFDVTNLITFPDGLPPNIQAGYTTWGDYDNDGLVDFILAGQDDSSTDRFAVYRQNQTGVFYNVTNINLFPGGVPPGFNDVEVNWGDFRKDGLLDFLISGATGVSVPTSYLYVQNSDGTFQNLTDASMFPDGLIQVYASIMGPYDYNNDGLLDFVLSGIDPSIGSQAKLYRNACPNREVWNGTDCLVCDGVLNPDHTVCTPCTGNTYVDPITESCLNCVGIASVDHTTCTPCLSDTIFNSVSVTCDPCPSGTQPNANQTACVSVATATSTGDDLNSASSLFWIFFRS